MAERFKVTGLNPVVAIEPPLVRIQLRPESKERRDKERKEQEARSTRGEKRREGGGVMAVG